MNVAFLFPGQGSQTAGMGRDVYDAYPEARARFEAADELLGFSLTEIMFGEDDEALRPTEITQPALYVHSLAVTAVLEKRGLRPDMTAGHSLGEYSALAAAGALSFEDGLHAVRRRGELMARGSDERPGTMAAVLGLENAKVELACQEASDEGAGVVQAANYNAPGQVVISGDVAAVELGVERANIHGARRAVPLPVSGAFHSPLMAHARKELGDVLESLDITEPRCPVYLNVTARPTTDPAEIRERLLAQLLSPVRWAQSLERMQADGAGHFVEVGPGRVLSGLVRRTLGRDVDTAQAGTAENITALVG